jgi:hypothetical protein
MKTKKNFFKFLLAIIFFSILQPLEVFAETPTVNKNTAEVNASDTRNFGNPSIGGWGTFTSNLKTWTINSNGPIELQAKTTGVIEGTVANKEFGARSDSSVKITDFASIEPGPGSISLTEKAERGSWSSKNLPDDGFAWSGNNSSFEKKPVTLDSCKSLTVNDATTAWGINQIDYKINDSNNKGLTIINQTGVDYNGPNDFKPSTVKGDLSFGGAVWGYGTKASGEGYANGVILNTPLKGNGNYEVFQRSTPTGGTETGAKATTTIK